MKSAVRVGVRYAVDEERGAHKLFFSHLYLYFSEVGRV